MNYLIIRSFLGKINNEQPSREGITMIKILTLGDWDIRRRGRSLLEAKGEQQRLFRLFKYFLTFEDEKITPERIYEDLFLETEYSDPKNVITTQISRLRHMFQDDTFYNIEYTGGYYTFKLKENCIVDFKEFEKLINKGNILMEKNSIDEAMILLERGISLYSGEYLADLSDDYWVISSRIKYNRLYLKGVCNFLDELKKRQEHEEIIEKTGKMIQLLPYDERVNSYFIETLAEIGEIKNALKHYECFTSRLCNDLKVNPSDHMKELCNRIQNNSDMIKFTKGMDAAPSNLIELKELRKDEDIFNKEEIYNNFLELQNKINLENNNTSSIELEITEILKLMVKLMIEISRKSLK